jgi:hypothetical protein
MITVYFLASTNDGPPAEIMESPTKLSHQCESDIIYFYHKREREQLKKTRIKKKDIIKTCFYFSYPPDVFSFFSTKPTYYVLIIFTKNIFIFRFKIG